MTTENNRLIAEFMGMKPHDINELDGFWTNTITAHKFDNVMNLQFHSDWNWLMQVVEKIESLDNQLYFVKIHTGGCFIHPINDTRDYKAKQYHKNKIEAVYNACVEFIKRYNENK